MANFLFQILQELGTVVSIDSSPDGEFVFLGLCNGVAVMDAWSLDTKAVWCQTGVEVVSLSSCLFDKGTYMMCAVDDMGWYEFSAATMQAQVWLGLSYFTTNIAFQVAGDC